MYPKPSLKSNDYFVHFPLKRYNLFNFYNFTGLAPAAGNYFKIFFRMVDVDHGWYIQVDENGNYNLYERNGTSTIRINGAGVLSGGERLVVVAADETITLYHDNTQTGTYSSASYNKTLTDGIVSVIGVGAIESNLINYPRTIKATAATLLNRAYV